MDHNASLGFIFGLLTASIAAVVMLMYSSSETGKRGSAPIRNMSDVTTGQGSFSREEARMPESVRPASFKSRFFYVVP